MKRKMTNVRPLAVSDNTLAAMLDMSKRKMYQLVGDGLLPEPVLIGDRLRWNVRAVQQWIDQGRVSDDDAS